MRLPDWEQTYEQDAGTFVPGAPFRLVLHTTQGTTIEGAWNTLSSRGVWPHFLYDMTSRRRVQGIGLDRAAKAMGNRAGGVETNRQGAIQVELVGLAEWGPTWTDTELSNLAVDIIVPMVRLGYCDLTLPPHGFVGAESGSVSMEYSFQRFSNEAWNDFHGICGHQHVPENGDRWDPGNIDGDKLVALARFFLDPTFPESPKRKRKNVDFIISDDGNPAIYVTDRVTGKRHIGLAEFNFYDGIHRFLNDNAPLVPSRTPAAVVAALPDL
jgi:hypothetical protein